MPSTIALLVAGITGQLFCQALVIDVTPNPARPGGVVHLEARNVSPWTVAFASSSMVASVHLDRPTGPLVEAPPQSGPPVILAPFSPQVLIGQNWLANPDLPPGPTTYHFAIRYFAAGVPSVEYASVMITEMAVPTISLGFPLIPGPDTFLELRAPEPAQVHYVLFFSESTHVGLESAVSSHLDIDPDPLFWGTWGWASGTTTPEGNAWISVGIPPGIAPWTPVMVQGFVSSWISGWRKTPVLRLAFQ